MDKFLDRLALLIFFISIIGLSFFTLYAFCSLYIAVGWKTFLILTSPLTVIIPLIWAINRLT